MISVIIPVHNVASYLIRCVESVVDNTYRNLEVLLIENGSTDDSLVCCKMLAEKHANVKFYSLEQSGVSVARNYGLDRAQGEYIAFIDADDYISNTYFERLIGIAEKNASDLVICNLIAGNEESYCFETCEYDYENVTVDEFLFGFFVKEKSCFSGPYSKLIKRDCVSLLRFDETIGYGEDRKFIMHLIKKDTKISYIDEKLYYYYRGNENSICKQPDLHLRMKGFLELVKLREYVAKTFDEQLFNEYVSLWLLRKSDFVQKELRRFGISDYDTQLNELITQSLAEVWRTKRISKTMKVNFLMEHYFPTFRMLLFRVKEKLK